jgi:hypothetical protein
MQKWEYMILYLNLGSITILQSLNQYGKEGWELVSSQARRNDSGRETTDTALFLKRKIQE